MKVENHSAEENFFMNYLSRFFKWMAFSLSLGTHQKEVLHPDLMFNGNAITAYCINKITLGDSSRFDPINLKSFIEKENVINYIKDFNQKIKISILNDPELAESEKSKGLIGYEYTLEEGAYELPGPYYCFYKHITNIEKHKHLIWVESAGGGTGRWSTLFILERKDNFIQNIGEIISGDRACGGMINVTHKNGNLEMIRYATPSEIYCMCLKLINPQHPLLSLDNKLSFAAQDYAGKVFLKGNVSGEFKPYKIRLDPLGFYQQDITDKKLHTWLNTEEYSLQPFFDTLIIQKLESGITELDEKAMKQFALDLIQMHEKREEISRCVKRLQPFLVKAS